MEKSGFERKQFHEGADLYVINTCSVTDHADRKCKKVVAEALRQLSDTTNKVNSQTKGLSALARDKKTVCKGQCAIRKNGLLLSLAKKNWCKEQCAM